MTQFIKPLAQQQIDDAESLEDKAFYRGYWHAHDRVTQKYNTILFVIFLCIGSYCIGSYL